VSITRLPLTPDAILAHLALGRTSPSPAGAAPYPTVSAPW